MVEIKNNRVTIRGESGKIVSFALEDLKKYSGTLSIPALPDADRIIYEPKKSHYFHDSEKAPLGDAVSRFFDELICEIDRIETEIEDPFFALSVDEAKSYKKEEMRKDLIREIHKKYSVFDILMSVCEAPNSEKLDTIKDFVAEKFRGLEESIKSVDSKETVYGVRNV